MKKRWMKLADNFLDHPKFVRLEQEAPSRGVHLWMGLMSYCKQQFNDGTVPLDMLRKINGPCWRWKRPTLEALIKVGLVERVDEHTVRLHDFSDWNPSPVQSRESSPPPATSAAGKKNKLELGGQKHEEATRRRRGDDEETTRSTRGDAEEALSMSSDLEQIPLSETMVPHVRARNRDGDRDRDLQIPLLTPQPPTASAQQPEKKSRQRPATAGKLGATRCPADFVPNASTLKYAASLGFSEALEQKTRAEFVSWWQGEGRTKLDWQATYRNWLLKTADRRGLKPPRKVDPQAAAYQREKRSAMRALEPHEIAPVPKEFSQVRAALFG